MRKPDVDQQAARLSSDSSSGTRCNALPMTYEQVLAQRALSTALTFLRCWGAIGCSDSARCH